MFIVHAPHLRSAVADHLPSGSPICSFGVTLAPKVLWGYKRQFAVCKSALCAFVPAISVSFRDNFSSAVGSVKQHSADIYAWCLQTAQSRCFKFNIQKTTKSIDFKSQYHLQNRVSCSVYFYSRKSLFRSFVILTIAVIYLKLLPFIAAYRQL